MAGKLNRVSRRMIFAWCMLGGMIMLFLPQGISSSIQFTFARLFKWPLRIGRNTPLSAKTEVPVSRQTDGFSQKERQYQNHIINLEEELRQKNEIVEQLTGLRTRMRGLEGAKLIPAEVITASAEGARGEIIINRGSDDGLKKDFFVIGDNSVIGTITELAGRTARVRLLSDSSSVVQVNIPGVGVNMLMQGSGNGLAKIKMVPVKHKIKTGDTVLIRKKPGFIDVGIAAGVVEKCVRDAKNATLWDITVKPTCDIAKLNSVAVIVMNPEAPAVKSGAKN
jgi:rod shape-determining protein MreC